MTSGMVIMSWIDEVEKDGGAGPGAGRRKWYLAPGRSWAWREAVHRAWRLCSSMTTGRLPDVAQGAQPWICEMRPSRGIAAGGRKDWPGSHECVRLHRHMFEQCRTGNCKPLAPASCSALRSYGSIIANPYRWRCRWHVAESIRTSRPVSIRVQAPSTFQLLDQPLFRLYQARYAKTPSFRSGEAREFEVRFIQHPPPRPPRHGNIQRRNPVHPS